MGDGWRNPSKELRRFLELMGILVAITLTGDLWGTWFQMIYLLERGTVCGNYVVDGSDLLLAFGVKFDDRVTSTLEAFASRAKIVHIDVDAAEVGINKQPHVSICADVLSVLKVLNNVMEGKRGKLYMLDFSKWMKELEEKKMKYQLTFMSSGDVIHPQYAIHEVLDTLTNMNRNRNRNAIVIIGSGQHRMWDAQEYDYDWL
ncbi:hypothetical protein RHGRI_006860 [Rhododendron griersonianum]|uniref:Thiamine pyrophosphate enzyme central domain-containing protein n=1 Tax=Rhododendron griersonianum TaxID=479676 RepID=A0AAV6KWC2_9ERIC|nr:hypothetical protein RHGRI_006860 [Rhododendron griersonianum]